MSSCPKSPSAQSRLPRPTTWQYSKLTHFSAETPAPSLIESHDSQEAENSPATPPEPIFTNVTTIKQEPTDSAFTFYPLSVDSLDDKSPLSPLDLTQHSAAMLCDLQCRSRPASSSHSPTTTMMPPSSPTSWALLFLYLVNLNLQTCYKAMLLALWSLFPSRMARLTQASTLHWTSRSKTSSTTPQLLRSMAMARSRAATGRLTPRQGAQAPLRTPVGEIDRARMVQAAVARRVMRVYQQRKALGKLGGQDPDDGRDENWGV